MNPPGSDDHGDCVQRSVAMARRGEEVGYWHLTMNASLETPRTVAAVVVDYNAGTILKEAIESLLRDFVSTVVVVENGAPGSVAGALAELATSVTIVNPGSNGGFGSGVNRGVAALPNEISIVLVCNPDIAVHAGATQELCQALETHPTWGIVGPTIVTPDGELYASVRRFPTLRDAAGHALLGVISPKNRFTRRYRSAGTRSDGGVDWVSGACFAMRRDVFEILGGFDESFFMFAEDMDLCWRCHEAGWTVGVAPRARVLHHEGVTRQSKRYRMIVEHHRSALRFQAKTTRHAKALLLPLATAVLGLRLVVALAREAAGPRGDRQS